LSGNCMRDPLKIAKQGTDISEYNRLTECLGDDTVVDFVTPGKVSLCIWTDPNDARQVCVPGAGSSACPLAVVNQDPTVPVTTACPAFINDGAGHNTPYFT